MPQQWPAADIARMILDGFDDYREHFRQITDGARARFEQAQWQEAQIASAARIRACPRRATASASVVIGLAGFIAFSQLLIGRPPK